MKFWCASAKSSKQRVSSSAQSFSLDKFSILQKSVNTPTIKRQDSFSSSASYASISSLPAPKSDSGYSETTSSSPTYSYLGQILHFERTYHEKLKQSIIKYSRPLRRVLNPQEIVELFQNIEKVNWSIFANHLNEEIFSSRFVQSHKQLFVNVKLFSPTMQHGMFEFLRFIKQP